jgi:hypothetical protein
METQYIVVGFVLLALFWLCTFRSENYSSFCGNCQDLTLEQCANCPNCGVCKNDAGCSKCVPGDEAGPYYRDECVDWKYRGKTPNKECWNYKKDSPYNCGNIYPYNKRSILHQKYASLHHQLGTNDFADVRSQILSELNK